MDWRFQLRYDAIKTFWFFARPIQELYVSIAQPSRKGVKVIIENNGAILLVRPNYGHRMWSLPGGGVKRSESFEDAARREILEELGLRVDALRFVGLYDSKCKRNVIQGFGAVIQNRNLVIDKVEIAQIGWFEPNTLPAERISRMNSLVARYLNQKTRNGS